MRFNDFIASSACVHKIMEQADDEKKIPWMKLRDFAGCVKNRVEICIKVTLS